MSGLAAILASFFLTPLTSTIMILLLDPQKFSLSVGPNGVAVEYEAKLEKEKAPEREPDPTIHKQPRLRPHD
ncbi:hypothetical protein GOD96_30360 [Sinorhizobium medicae]|nr:hypothetical protein [Sinorhizobium medicae]